MHLATLLLGFFLASKLFADDAQGPFKIYIGKSCDCEYSLT